MVQAIVIVFCAVKAVSSSLKLLGLAAAATAVSRTVIDFGSGAQHLQVRDEHCKSKRNVRHHCAMQP